MNTNNRIYAQISLLPIFQYLKILIYFLFLINEQRFYLTHNLPKPPAPSLPVSQPRPLLDQKDAFFDGQGFNERNDGIQR